MQRLEHMERDRAVAIAVGNPISFLDGALAKLSPLFFLVIAPD